MTGRSGVRSLRITDELRANYTLFEARTHLAGNVSSHACRDKMTYSAQRRKSKYSCALKSSKKQRVSTESTCCEIGNGKARCGVRSPNRLHGGVPPKVMSKKTIGLGSVVSAMVAAVQCAATAV